MRVLRLCWLGVPTGAYEETVRLFRDVLGLRVEFEEPATIELSSAGDERVQVFAPGHHYDRFFSEHASGPVPLFEVEDVRAAKDELRAAGIELVGALDQDAAWEWLHFRGPDGHLYAIASRLPEE